MKEALLDAHVKLVKKNAITIAALKARIKELEEIGKWRSEGGIDPQTNKMWLTRHMREKAEALSALWKAEAHIKELEAKP